MWNEKKARMLHWNAHHFPNRISLLASIEAAAGMCPLCGRAEEEEGSNEEKRP
jgi:hypothetical protein